MAAAAVLPAMPEFHADASASARTPSPPVWQRPAGSAPRPFLSKGAGQLSTSPRVFHRVSRNSNSNGAAEICAATYSSRALRHASLSLSVPALEPHFWRLGVRT